MKYTDLSINLGFHKNMQETNWLKLFPKWWAENDPLLETIGKEITRIKADSIFALLNTTLKPPAMIWQESIVHKTYTESFSINKNKDEDGLSELVQLPAPLYKTYGTIRITNNTVENINNFKIALNDKDYIIISEILKADDIIDINVGSQKVYINKQKANVIINNDGLSYFKTSRDKKRYVPTIQTSTDSDIICHTITVPIDFIGSISLTNENNIVLYKNIFNDNEFSEDIIIDEENEVIKRNFYIANSEENQKVIIQLYDDPFYFNAVINTKDNKIKVYDVPKPLHNEIVSLFFDFGDSNNINIDVDVTFNDVVFVNEQHIEVHGLELIPIKQVDLYAYYDFPYNPISTGWRKVYEKPYDPKTEVIYDRITTHFYTKKFYVEVFFEGLDHPYQVGFPCYKDAEKDSMYHINENIDEWGKYFGLPRRKYRENIVEEDYPFTFPPYYPFDIEQDYWYYQRLINEYAWNDLAINDVDLKDTDGNSVIRLHSINPFVEDFVVETKSVYAEERENIDYNMYIPTYVTQDSPEADYKRAQYFDTHNLLKYDNNKAYVTLANNFNTNITTQKYISKKLITYFNLESLPDNINIDDIEILVEAESTDNSKTKYSNTETGIIIPEIGEVLIPMQQSDSYELEEKEIIYTLKDGIDKVKKLYDNIDQNVLQKATIKSFGGQQNSYISIPFELKENDEIVDDITEVYVTYNNNQTYEAEYHNDGDQRYIYVYLPTFITDHERKTKVQKTTTSTTTEETKYYAAQTPNIKEVTYSEEITLNIACKTENHSPFLAKDITMVVKIEADEDQEIDEDDNKTSVYTRVAAYGPYYLNEKNKQQTTKQVQTQEVKNEWHTGNFRNMLQQDGLYFVNVFQNDDDKTTPTILIKNIRLKISHSPKKSQFNFKTELIKKDDKPIIAQLKVIVTNTGTKSLQTDIDIISATNLKLSKNYINVDLNVGETIIDTIDIIPEYPIIDGQYEILTLCEDKIAKNTLTVFGEGLIQTDVIISPHYGQYNEEITLKAKVGNISNININDNVSKMYFYINDYKVGETLVRNNMASITVQPSALKLLSGIHQLEARFSGNTKFASSRAHTTLLISQNDIDIKIFDTLDKVKYQDDYTIKALFTFEDNPITEGTATFFIDEEQIGQKDLDELGIASIIDPNIEYLPGIHILGVQYSGTNQYVGKTVTKEIEIVGGETTLTVFNASGKPSDEITIRVKVTDMNSKNISSGKLTFNIDNEEPKIVDVINGYGTTTYKIPDTIPNNQSEYEINFNVSYVDDLEIYQPSQKNGKIIVKKHPVTIEGYNYFYASQYEPLGFYFNIKDAITGEPVEDGTITINIPDQNITNIKGTVDKDGGVRIIHNPVDFSAKEFNQLLKFHFQTNELLDTNNLVWDYKDNGEIVAANYVDGDDVSIDNLYRIYSGDLKDLNYMDFNVNENKELEFTQSNRNEPAPFEQVFIGTDGYLYARTSIDSIRKYLTGICGMEIIYTSANKYETQTLNCFINFEQGETDIDLLSYTLKYSMNNETIKCYVTEYNLDDNEYNINMNDGTVYFYIDNQDIGQATPVDGIAELPITSLQNVDTDIKHLLTAEYIPINRTKKMTQTFSYLKLESITSNITGTLDTIFSGGTSKLKVTLSVNDENKVDITGTVNVYLNDEKVGIATLLGTENIIGNVSLSGFEYATENGKNLVVLYFDINIPNDININDYKIFIEYSGNEHIQGTSYTSPTITPELVNLEEIIVSNINVAKNEQIILPVTIKSNYQDFVNEGKITISAGIENPILATSIVKNNNALLKFQAPNTVGSYKYKVEYSDSTHYNILSTTVTITVSEPKDIVIIPNDAQNFEQAQQLVTNNGTIIIDEDIELHNDINITKNLTIIGGNDVSITKDIIDLLIDNNLSIYKFDNFDNLIYKINNLTVENINANDFIILNSDIYFNKNDEMIPIFLLEDGFFYSYNSTLASNITSNLSINIPQDINVHIDNVIFDTQDINNNYDFIINNEGNLTITKSILNKNVSIKNKKELTINNSLVYCKILGTGINDLNNNWWGSNDKPQYDVTNHIILKITTDNDPAIIGEDITVRAYLIGQNNRVYDLPAPQFLFTSETGYFSIENGFFVDGNAYTTYIDGTQEEEIYCSVDNETVGLMIYDYDHKTEVILDPATEIPIGYQIPFKAKVQSCADIFYKFDNNNHIIKQSNNINQGFVSFELNGEQIGRARVQNGEAILPIYISSQYTDKTVVHLKATYESDDYYFSSSNEKDITLIDDQNVCYVSQNGSNNNLGTFDAPVNSIQQAIMLNKDVIYLKEGYYTDVVNVTGTQTIKKYNYDVIFENYDTPIFTTESENVTLDLDGLTFVNNNAPIIENISTLNITNCTFYNNDVEYLIDNKENTFIEYSAIVDNNLTLKDYSKNYTLNYNWYGTNDLDKINDGEHITNYLYMTTDQSKDIIYTGSVAIIIGQLKHVKYISNDIIETLDKEIPLRIALFNTPYGSFMPIKDYTYYNKAISFLNTNDVSNINHIVLELPSNTNYINRSLVLTCYANDIYGNPIEDGTITFNLNDEKHNIPIENGKAELKLLSSLPLGEHELICTYTNNDIICSTSQKFIVQKPEMIITEINLDPYDHIYKTLLVASFVDNFNNQINKQNINIYIDNILIKEESIINGEINTTLSYEPLNIGQHILTIATDDYQDNYEDFKYNYIFYVNKKEVSIKYDYYTLPLSDIDNIVKNDLEIYITDYEKKNVSDGTIKLFFDNEPIYLDDDNKYSITETEYTNIQIENGVATLYDFYCTTRGTHYLTIHYIGNEQYQDKIIEEKIEIGTDEVIIKSNILLEQLEVELGKPLKFNFPITDQSGKPVRRGKVHLHLLGHTILEEDITLTADGYVIYNEELPPNTKPMDYNLEITYEDDTNRYQTTKQTVTLTVKPIETQILIGTFNGVSNQVKTIDYKIESKYGDVLEGILYAYYDDQEIGQKIVSDIDNTMDLNIPLLSDEHTHIINFKYHSQVGNYKDSELDVNYIATKERPQINITPKQYYPKEEFNLIAYITDQNNKAINFGQASLYVDNVKIDTTNVINGRATFYTSFDNIKEYDLIILYDENEYYEQSREDFIFTVNNIPINNIIINDLPTLPNTQLETIISFDADFKVTDGMIDFIIDGELINTYAIIQNNKKYVKLNILNISAGTHILTMKYYDSLIFENKEVNIDFVIDKQDPTMILNIPSIVSLQDTINIKTTNLPTNTNATIEYYLYPKDFNENPRFIKILNNNNKSEVSFDYTLPYLDESNYVIKAQFIENDQYNTKSIEEEFTIEKSDITLSISNQSIEYQSSLEIEYDIEDTNFNEKVFFSIEKDNEYILLGSTKAENGFVTFEQKLDSQYSVGQYNLKINTLETTVYNSQEQIVTLDIVPTNPILQNNIIKGYINQNIILEPIFVDHYNNEVSGEIVCENYPNLAYTITNEEEQSINIQFTPNNNNFNSTNNTLYIEPMKNVIEWNLSKPEYVTRGKQYRLELTMTSTNSEIPTINFVLSDGTNSSSNINLSNFIVPTSFNDVEYFTLTIQLNNDNFEYKEEEFILYNQNYNEIYVANEPKEDSVVYNTLEDALHLIGDHGKIIIEKDITTTTECTNNKQITILGNNHTVSNNIINQGVLTIKDLTFKNCITTAITTTNELHINNCIFDNNGSCDNENNVQYGGAIYINNKNKSTTIKNCTFNGNKASIYGGAIYSNKGNDITIQNNEFTNNGCNNKDGSSIAVNGKMYISNNIFYDNNGQSEIYTFDGQAIIENNYFDGKCNIIISNRLQNTDIQCNLNYFGYNDYNNIQEKMLGSVKIDSWLISDYDIEYTEPQQGNVITKITPRINKYKNNLEIEITSFNGINKKIPLYDDIKLNEIFEIPISELPYTLTIGKEQFIINGE